jgi:hypothetical protein
MLDRAANLALGFVAFNLAFGASEFLTSCGALGRLAHGLTNLITHGFITLPLALGMAIVSISAVSARIGAAACSKSALFLCKSKSHKGKDKNRIFHFVKIDSR